MTETRRTHLHLGKCIEDLDKLYNVPDLKTKRTTVLCKTALKLFEKAEEFREKGDEEYAYVYYMKYLRVVAFLSKDKDYQKDKAYYNSMLGTKNPNKAIDAAENLKKSLIDRYALEPSARLDKKMAEEPKKIAEPVTIVEPSPTAGLPDLDEVTMKSEQLYPILKAGKLRVMILDCRPGKDFLESHINYHACISVPEECISPGQSANVLEQNLPLTSRAVWAERAAMELIVMLDWNSTTVIPGKTLFLLKTILLKWDVKVHYSRPPLALWGGYEDWILKYPALTTNPQVVPPSQQDMMEDMLGDIDYPNWSDLTPPAPPPAPAPRAPSARPFKASEPYVDRSSKAAAVQMYEERSRNMQLILDKQERIADTSLTLEMQRIEAEQDWERVRGQREGEVRDELRAMYKLREQEIISQLMQLENKQYDMEQENQQLREQLEDYQRREREESSRLAASLAGTPQGPDDGERQRVLSEQAASARDLAAKRARIAAVTEQRDQLDRRREQMEAERKRKLAEAREKKKPDLDKDEDGDTYMSSPADSPGSPTLNRSQSSPNLANGTPCSEDEEPSVPAFDRSTKPNKVAPSSDMRTRDLDPCWAQVVATLVGGSIAARGREESKIVRCEQRCIPLDAANMALKVKVRLKNSHHQIVWLFRRGRGLTGLRNLGNTCYMNSILQCLNNTTFLITYFCNGQYIDHINRSNVTRGAVAEEFAVVVRALWSGQYKFIAAKDLRNELGKHQRAFRTTEQQDSHEFLTILMDWLHLDLQINVKPPPKETWTASDKAWYEFTRGKESLISRLFYGQIKSTVRCTVCGKTSVTYDSFSNLSLELPANASRCTLSDCLKLYLNGETIPGWNCPTCNEKRDAVKKLDIARLPPVLVIHFKRFFVDKDMFSKRLTYIDFPLSDLDMKPFALHAPSSSVYDLYAVSNHYGSMVSGHYTAFCKSSMYSKWYHYDDHLINEIPASDVKSSAAYILFYSTCRTV